MIKTKRVKCNIKKTGWYLCINEWRTVSAKNTILITAFIDRLKCYRFAKQKTLGKILNFENNNQDINLYKENVSKFFSRILFIEHQYPINDFSWPSGNNSEFEFQYLAHDTFLLL